MSLTTTEENFTHMGVYTGEAYIRGGRVIHGRKIALVIWGAYTRGSLYTGGGGVFTEFYGNLIKQEIPESNYQETIPNISLFLYS